jgi:hypothetical protein
LWWEPALALGDYNPAVFTDYEPELAPEAITVAQEQAQGRIKGLAYPLWFQSGTDPDPTNNQATMFFQTAPPLLPPGVLAILNQVMGGSTPLEFIWEVLTGQSDNWWAIGGNIVLSFAPIAGTVLDLISLFTDPTPWGKAMSLIGLVASIISDGAEILTAVGVAVPPALVALPAAVGAEAIDVGAAILKNVRRLVSADVFSIIKNIPFDDALKLGVDVLGHLAKRAVAEAGGASNWPGSIDEVFSLIQNVLSAVWDPFVALVKHYGTVGLDKLFTLGFGEGGFLAGRVLKQGGEFTDVDKVVEGVAKIGDDLLGQAAADLSDDATKFLSEIVDDVGESNTRVLLNGITCPVGITQVTYHKTLGLASPLSTTAVDKCLEALANITPGNSQDGFKKLMGTTEADAQEALKVWNKYQSHPARDHLFEILNDSNIIDGADFTRKLEVVGGIDKTDKFKEVWDLVDPNEINRLDGLIRRVENMKNLGKLDEFDEIVDIMLKWERKPIPTSLPQLSNPSNYNYNGADVGHFLDGHTYEYFNPLGRIKPGGKVDSASFWPEGTTPKQVVDYLQKALDQLKKDGRLPNGIGQEDVTISTSLGDIVVRVGVLPDSSGKGIVRQFVPLAGPGIVKLKSSQMASVLPIFQ